MLHGLEGGLRRVVKKILNETIKTELVQCKYCHSDALFKYGRNRHGAQRYLCTDCQKVFLNTDNLPRMRVSVKQLGDVIGQYYGGMSLKELRRQFKQQHGELPSRSSFDRWLAKFSEVAVNEAKKYHPKVGEKWLADECVLKIGGKNVWCWDVIDKDSRFLLATHLSSTRTTQDAKTLMEKALKVAGGKAPTLILTDSLRAYIDGIELTFGSETKHIQTSPFSDADLSTNVIERWHSTLKTRMDIMRGLKSPKTAQALLDGWLVHYNYFRTHESLRDKTPAEAAEIKFPFKNWLDVIESQRLVIKPGSTATGAVPAEQIEQHKHPTYKAALKRKIKRVRKAGTDISIGGVRNQ